MVSTVWNQRFLKTTRGRIVDLLRREPRTAEALARAIGLTPNAVRGHLALLERDGMIQADGMRRGVGKPAHIYRLTAAAEAQFSKAYAPMLRGLLDELASRLDPAQLEELLRATGQRLAPRAGAARDASDEQCIAAAEAALAELGGVIASVTANGTIQIDGLACPLAEVTGTHAAVCRGIEALLSGATGRTVTERCERTGGRARCRFEMGK
ncbi:MAG TPA: helix-turn-helix domain-containing protein [Gemmatimonadales bacterium]|nr:helix-turn-helix domain-containing protein [Gemmatimonadales bacterium]